MGKTTGVNDDNLEANVQIPMTESGKTADLSVASDSESGRIKAN